MSDTYKNYYELSKNETKNLDYKIISKDLNSKVTCISIHGGNIEPGTSEVATGIANNYYNLYKFEGIKSSQNSTLHITSSNFDEPKAIDLVSKSEKVISIHGAKGIRAVTYIGGLDENLKERIKNNLKKAGFKVGTPRKGIDGLTKDNIVNRGLTKAGCQLEISLAQRKLFFDKKILNSSNRINKTPLFYDYVKCIREALEDN